MTELKIGVVGTPGKWSTEHLADCLAQRTGYRRVIDMGKVALDLERSALMDGDTDLCQLDGLVVKKISEVYSPAALDRLDMLRFAEARGVRVFSPTEPVLRLIDRLSCTVTLAASDIPMPPTVVTENPEMAEATVRRFGVAVLKPLYSTKARGMTLLEGAADDLADQIAAYRAEHPVIYIQKKADLSGKDLGMVFLGGQYICTYARVSQTGAWNTTINSGGKYEAFAADDDLISLATRAQAPFGLTFTTVDVALTPGGPIVFEVSAFGGFRGAKEGAGVDAAALLADHVVGALSP
ncbi:MAG: GAK system ATP-grasp enzyme [Pseudomonadota bacterium]